MDYRTETNKDEPFAVRLIYLSDWDISAEAQDLIVDEIRKRLNYPDAVVSLERVESTLGPLTFSRNQTALSTTATATIDRAGQILQQHPTWRIEIAADPKEMSGPDGG